jgi:DNA-directed RNA polymerase specialized sigma24 family protein
MKKGWVLTQELFDTLLGWLDPDRERAGDKYETMRIRLIKVFTCRGCAEAEELADETINRVASKLKEIRAEWEGDPALYFHKVAQYVLQEWRRDANKRGEMPEHDPLTPLVSPNGNDEDDIEHKCLGECLEKLIQDERKLFIEYSAYQGRAKIVHHQQMAIAMGIAINALRIKVCRIRRQLKGCVLDCVQREQRNGFNM